MILKYVCENDKCSKEGDIKDITPGKSVQCEECGWFMRAVD